MRLIKKKLAILAILALSGLIVPFHLSANEHSSFLIINAKIIDGSGGPSRFESVRINGNRIEEVGQ